MPSHPIQPFAADGQGSQLNILTLAAPSPNCQGCETTMTFDVGAVKAVGMSLEA
jgi:hypothetical protein